MRKEQSNSTMVVFLHGMNTHGDDEIHIGPLTFGSMTEAIVEELSARKIEVLAITGIGQGSPDELAERARKQLTQKPHAIVGHSIGGLVARVLGAQLDIAKIISFGTPHHGTEHATRGLEFPQKHRLLTPMVARLGYDPRPRAQTFQHFTPEALEKFNSKYPARAGAISLVCDLPAKEINWLYRVAWPPKRGDGFISTESQQFGETRGPFRLDHYGQQGLHLYATAKERKRSESEFRRLMAEVASIVSI